MLRTRIQRLTGLFAFAASTVFVPIHSFAQAGGSEAASSASVMPLASVLGTGVGISVAIPVALSTSGAALAVRAIEASAEGTIFVLERLSDGAKVSVQVSTNAAKSASVTVGTVATVSVIASGVALTVAGKVIAFIPNEVSKAMLHTTKVTE